MSKKKLSKRKTVNKQTISRSNRTNVAPKRSLMVVALSFLGIQLVDKVFDTILEQPVKDLLSVVVNWIKSILA